MHRRLRSLILSALVLTLFIGSVVFRLQPPQTVWAANASLSLSPASQTVNASDTVTIIIKVDTGGDPVNAVQANLTYPTAIFDSVAITSTPSFDVIAENTAGSGTIKVARGATTPVNGVVDVATLTLHAVGSGTQAINFAGGSMIVRSTDNVNILATTAGGSYTVTAPAPPTPPPSSTCSKKGDYNCDGRVNALDLGTVLANYGSVTSIGDINKDGKVNALDLGLILANYGL
jgi:hypothetical protein